MASSGRGILRVIRGAQMVASHQADLIFMNGVPKQFVKKMDDNDGVCHHNREDGSVYGRKEEYNGVEDGLKAAVSLNEGVEENENDDVRIMNSSTMNGKGSMEIKFKDNSVQKLDGNIGESSHFIKGSSFDAETDVASIKHEKMNYPTNANDSLSSSSTAMNSAEGVGLISAVPSGQISRAAGFAKLGVGLAFGAVAEGMSRLVGTGNNDRNYPLMASDANADRLAATLCRMRGAALKIGQMLSIQDETTVLPPPIARAMQSVRQGANSMPQDQLMTQLENQLGSEWRQHFSYFNEDPIAAASIGQVHEGILKNSGKRVALKVQYPGVANSIESDLSNLEMLMRLSGLAPPGLFLEEIIRVGRKELMVECDYVREREQHLRFKNLIESDDDLLKEGFVVPGIIDQLSTKQVITTEYAAGSTIEKVSGLSQDERNRIGRNILKLTIKELFVWRFMQTDPNWGNFLYDVGTQTTSLIDFGAAKEFDKHFVDSYLKIVYANANKDRETLLLESHKLGFLTGKENHLMVDAHVQSGFVVGEPFAIDEPYDFRASKISARMSEHGTTFMRHRLT